MRLFSTEQVSRYHPDKVADQISDAILDACLAEDPLSRVACECMVKSTTIILAGEITTKAQVNYGQIATKVATKLGYKVDQVLTYIETQSPQISQGIREGDDMGAGDQGMMYGYATRETESRLPYGFDLANRIIEKIEHYTVHQPRCPFQGDAKCQVTVDLDEEPGMKSVKKILVSVCHTPGNLAPADALVRDILYTLGVPLGEVEVIINPAGEWTIGGPAADCGLTGRKIVCDQYGGYCPVGGGAFSGKDPSKVDRSGAYMARKIACDLLEQFDLFDASVQIAYAIGKREPMSVCVTSHQLGAEDAGYIAEWVKDNYDLTPAGIIKTLNLLEPQYEKLAGGCHFRLAK
jgi:S-adenosylmethionine synthetase